ncbi:MAG: Gfo/Idh/MocA family oxidoreductase [Bacteroidales bacterium]|nr:MAG: Gfo/Idh/MocA family oxidoreductase [Bacteroidales bacterium]
MKRELSRRSFLKISALSGAMLGISGLRSRASDQQQIQEILEKISQDVPGKGTSVMGLTVPPISQVRVGIIGLGNRGFGMTRLVNTLCPDKATITAICDIRQEMVDKTLDFLKKEGQDPANYSGTENAWKELVARDDIDLIMVFTHWDLHVPMCIEAMLKGKHVVVEVPAAYTVEDCWKLVNTAEETRKNCMMLENVCYGAEELWILNMVKNGVFGTLTHAEAAYIHNLRTGYLFSDVYYNMWRIRHHLNRDGNLYTTHGLGPVAQYLDIERGDRFEFMTSMSSLQASLSEYSETVEPDNEFFSRSDFKHGDMNSSLIKTAMGRTILLQHDVVTPRPYSRINALAGTRAYHEGYPSRLSVEGAGHDWLGKEEYKEYWDKYQHPVWESLKEPIEKYGGHGGMDFVEIYRLIDNLNKGLPLDMDVYDAASWSVVGPLSEISVELGSAPVKFPDFTRGRWKEKRLPGILEHV